MFLILLLGLPLPIAAGQTSAGWPQAELLTDPQGDVTLGSYDNPQLRIPITRPDADILGLSLLETDTSIVVLVKVGAPPDENQATTFLVTFRFAGRDFVAWLAAPTAVVDSQFEATLYEGTPRGPNTEVGGLSASFDSRLVSWAIIIPKTLVGSVTERPPVAGEVFLNWSVSSRFLKPANQDAWIGDQAPDDGTAGLDYVLKIGFPQDGPIRLAADEPYIVSNGLATSYPLQITISNDAPVTHKVRLVAENLPHAWQMTVPQEAITVKEGTSQTVSLVLTVPFRHQHGAIDAYQLVALKATDGQRAAVLDMGIVYTDPPQPAGHHNQLYIHGGPAGGYLNTLPEDSADTGTTIASRFEDYGTWNLTLSPNLGIGLDFDLDRIGTLDVQATGWSGVGRLILRGALQLVGDGEPIDLAILNATDVFSLEPAADVTFHTTLVPQPQSDFVPFTPGTQLVLHLEITSDDFVQASLAPPSLVPGGILQLPLFDFHDDVQGVLRDVSGLSWSAPSAVMELPPGGHRLLDVRLEAEPGRGRRVNVNVDSGDGIAEFQGHSEAFVDDLNPLNGQVLVSIPESAQDGDLYDALVVAQDDTGILAVLRISVIVDSAAESQVVAGVETGTQESPPASMWTSLIGVLAFAFFGRRRRT